MTDPPRIDDIVAQVAHALRQADKDARNWEAQSKDWERVCVGQRAELEAAQKERDETARRLFRADRALADMVNQYMSFPEGFITHEFTSAQEEAIDYLETIGWLRAGELERYYWTDAATGTNFPLKASEE